MSGGTTAARTFERHRGVSLIELVIATGLLALLLGLAVPGYQQYVLRGHRTAAIELLLDAARCQERVYAREFRYDTTRCPIQDPSGRYRVRVEPADTVGALAYAVIADPQGSQRSDPCGSLVLDQTGRRTVSGSAESLRRCWAGR